MSKKLYTKGERIFSIVNVVIMIILLFLVLYPLWYTVIYSLSDANVAARGEVFLWPKQFTTYNYYVLFKNHDIFNAFLITVLRTVIGTVLSVLFTAIVAYPLSKSNLIGRKFFLTLGTITLVFSAGILPNYFVVKQLGLLDNFAVYIVPFLFSFYNCVIFMTFFKGIPGSLEESAQIDGANDLVTFFKIILPVSMPVIATIALFNGVFLYNDYFTGVLYIQNPHLLTIQHYLYQIISNADSRQLMKNVPASFIAANKTSSTSLQYAAMILTSIPIVVVYPFLQKYFVKGVLIGAVKG